MSQGGASNRRKSFGGSIYTERSDDKLSVKEVKKIKRWMIDKERSERKNNIVIKGIKLEGD